jgi:hypothetical protein
LFVIEERADGFGAVTWVEGEVEAIEEGAGVGGMVSGGRGEEGAEETEEAKKVRAGGSTPAAAYNVNGSQSSSV